MPFRGHGPRPAGWLAWTRLDKATMMVRDWGPRSRLSRRPQDPGHHQRVAARSFVRPVLSSSKPKMILHYISYCWLLASSLSIWSVNTTNERWRGSSRTKRCCHCLDADRDAATLCKNYWIDPVVVSSSPRYVVAGGPLLLLPVLTLLLRILLLLLLREMNNNNSNNNRDAEAGDGASCWAHHVQDDQELK